MTRFSIFRTTFFMILLLVGCSSGNQNPVTPPSDEESINQLTGSAMETPQGQQYLWGYYELLFDVENRTVEVIPVRSVEFTANIVKFLNNDPQGLQVDFNGTTPGTGYIDINMDITIKHPLAQNPYDGYDVRGIFMGNGSQTMGYNADLLYSSEGTDQILLNADGYTRWVNPTEFTVPNLFGYIPGKLAAPGYIGTATLNPYKYFGEALDAESNAWYYLVSGDPNVGYFLAGTSNTRDYMIRFKIPVPGIKYGYAVIANWSGAAPQFHPSHAPEALAARIEDNSTLYYVDEATNGGNLILDISVFDWDAELTGGVMEDYSVFIESTVLTSVHEISSGDLIPIASGAHWFTYHVNIPADNVTGVDDNEVWVIVEDSSADYTNPAGVPNTADGDKIAACFRYPLTVDSEEPKGITVTQPNGGEQWKAQGSGEITWTASGDIQNVRIDLSINSGVNYAYTIVDSTPNDGSFTWDSILMAALGDTNRIKVVDIDDTNVFDESDADFSVILPTIEVTSPNGGECWVAGYDSTITWEADPAIDDVTIMMSLNSGADYSVMVIDSTPNDGEFIWDSILGDFASTYCRIRVQELDYPLQIFDESDADFEIGLPEIKVVIPNGGEFWTTGSTQEIHWTSDPIIENVYIYLSMNSGNYYSYVLAGPIPNTGAWVWDSILSQYISPNCRIKVNSAEIPQAYDESNEDFEISEPWILVTYPNGGETWKVGGSYDITWEADPSIENVTIEASIDSGNNYTFMLADSTPNDGVCLNENVPEEAVSDHCRIRISDSDDETVKDESDADFIVQDAWINLIEPNGGEELPVGSDYEITWDCSETGGTVSIIYTKDDFNSDFHEIVPDAPNTGSYIWTSIPDDISDTVKVGVEFSDLFLRDSSDDYFSIIDAEPFITVTEPNGGEELRANHSFEITWTSNLVTGPVNIWYSKDNFVGDVNYITDNTPNDGSFIWDPIPFDPSYTVKIKVESSYDTGINDTSDNYFHLAMSGWVKTWGDTSEDVGYGVVSDEYSNAYVVGYSSPGVASLRKYSEDGLLIWNTSWGYEGEAAAYGVAVDNDSNVYVTGWFMGTDVDFDPGFGTALRTSDANGDIFLSRFGPSGNFSYVKTWGGYSGTSYERGTDIIINGTDLFITGYFTGTNVDFDPGAGANLRSSAGGCDVFLSKFSTSGSLAWALTWGGLYDDKAHGLRQVSDINVVGSFCGTNVDFDPDPVGTSLKSSNGDADAFMSRIDYYGDWLGTYTWGGDNYDVARSLNLGGGGFYVTGYFQSPSIDFDPESGTDIKTVTGESTAYLCKYNGAGYYVWTQTWGGDGDTQALDLTTDSNYYPVVVGWFEGGVDFDPSGSTDLRNANGITDAYCTNFDPDGNFLGARTWGGSNEEQAISAYATESWPVVITGLFSSISAEFAPVDSPCFDESDIHSTTGSFDAYLLKYMPDWCW